MLFILLSWVYTFLIATTFGIIYKHLLNIKTYNTTLHQVLGLFSLTLFTSFVAFFYRINIEFYCTTLVLSLCIIFYYKKAFINELQVFINEIKQLNGKNKFLFFFITLVVLAQSSTKPYLLDNESYYAQTIKWINEYGYVKGLVNIHPFLAQNSGWHTLQAATNFSFLTDRLNDNNGFLFVLISLFTISGFQKQTFLNYLNNGKYILILLFFPFLMQFINAPSPDLILFIVTPIVFYLFIENYVNTSLNDFKLLLSLTLFLCFSKVTAAILCLPVLFLFIKHYKLLKTQWIHYLVISGITLFFFCLKNTIITGYEFFPFKAVNFAREDWEIPKSLLTFYTHGTFAAFDNVNVNHLNLLEKFWFWLNTSKLHGVFNKLFILLLLIYPFFILRKEQKQPYIIIYLLAIIHFIVLWNISPQYRFFFMFILFFSIEIFSAIFKNSKWYFSFISFGIIVTAYILMFGINLKYFTTNKHNTTFSQFSINNGIIPEKNTKINSGFTQENILGFKFNSPAKDVFFWATGSGDLPCVNKQQIDFFKKHYKLIPKQRTESIKDGFKSVLIID